jgi:hypothetical protein
MAASTRPVIFASGDLTLEGALHLPAGTPSAGVVVCHPHPQYGGDMDNNVVLAVCEALVARNIAALRFNFRGTGKSGGAFDGGEGEQDDVRAALACLAAQPEVDGGRLGLAGYSFGAMVAARVEDAAARSLALISPPVAMAGVPLEHGCPVIVLAGGIDPIAPAEGLRALAEEAGAELYAVAEADHSWWGFEAELGEALGEFFANTLRAAAPA